MPESAPSIHGVTLFAGLDARAAEALSKQCKWRRCGEGQEVLGAKDSTTDIYFVVTGSLRANVFTKRGHQVNFRDVPAGAFFGELAAIDGAPRSASILATTDSLIASLSGAAFRKVLREQPAVAEALFLHLARQVRYLSERVTEFTALDVKGRIQAELLRLARDHMTGANAAEVKPMPKHGEIASWVSTHREAVTRELNFLDRAGVIERHPGRLVVRDVAKLAALVAKTRD